jgi:hypothetical protein
MSLVLSACTLSNMTPQARFSDAAHTLNDAARWGRVDIASQYVAPEYLERFRKRRAAWGRGLSIAEAELSAMQLAPDNDSAVTEVSLSWHDAHGVSLRTTVIRQTWEARRGTFKLIDESIQSGDPRIFADAEAEEDEDSREP